VTFPFTLQPWTTLGPGFSGRGSLFPGAVIVNKAIATWTGGRRNAATRLRTVNVSASPSEWKFVNFSSCIFGSQTREYGNVAERGNSGVGGQ
jgi:hypothetical protein